jgi:hypothetical protein
MRSSLGRRKTVAVAVAAVAVLAAGCGSAAPSTAGTPRPTSPAASGSPQQQSAICSDAAALRTSLDRIVGFQPGKDALAGLRADLAGANRSLAALRASPGNPLSPELTALATTLKKLRTEAVHSAVTARPAGIAEALGDVKPKVRTFIAAAKAQCPEL